MVMKDINIHIDLSQLGTWMNAVAARFGHITRVDILFIIVSLVVPPIAVLIKVGFTAQFWINVLLTILGFIPGQIHALWVVLFL
jgi:uncharacterized membrane protein YqaE (UPF0057 family)